MEKKLPKGWIEIKIADLTKIISGGTPSTTRLDYFDGEIPWITPADLSGYKEKYIQSGRRNISQEGLKNSSAKLLPKGTVLFSSRAPIGYVAIAANELTTNQGFKNLFPNPAFDSSYAYYYLKYIKDDAEAQASGTTFKELSGLKMGQLPFLLAPIAEQRRIAEKLDKVFEKQDLLKLKLQGFPQLIANLRRCAINSAITGKLTGIDHIVIRPLKEYLTEIKYGTSQKSDYKNSGVPVLRIPNIKNGEIDSTDLKFSSLDKAEFEKLQLKEGDVLIIRSNGSLSLVGQSAIVRKDHLGFAYAGYLIRLRLNDVLNPEYLNLILKSSFIRDQIENMARSTTGVNNINTDEIKGLEIPVPSRTEQDKIVAKLKLLLQVTDQLELKGAFLREKLDAIPKMVLAKAFQGKLVHGNINDEPAIDY